MTRIADVASHGTQIVWKTLDHPRYPRNPLLCTTTKPGDNELMKTLKRLRLILVWAAGAPGPLPGGRGGARPEPRPPKGFDGTSSTAPSFMSKEVRRVAASRSDVKPDYSSRQACEVSVDGIAFRSYIGMADLRVTVDDLQLARRFRAGARGGNGICRFRGAVAGVGGVDAEGCCWSPGAAVAQVVVLPDATVA